MKRSIILIAVVGGLSALVLVSAFMANSIRYVGDNKSLSTQGFNPLTAADEELKYFGFPERSSDPSWEGAMAHSKQKIPFRLVPMNHVLSSKPIPSPG